MNDLDLIKSKIVIELNQTIAIDVYESIIKKFPYLTLEIKWNEPFLCFQEHPIIYFTEKTKIDNTIFTEPTIFLGFVSGFKLYSNQLFISSSHTQVRFINLNKLKKNQILSLIKLIGQALEV